eukprot:742111-Amphidinium_carterae.1
MAIPEASLPEDYVDGRVDGLVSVGLYSAGGDSVGTCSVMYVEIEGAFLRDGLQESTPAQLDSTTVTFGEGVPYAPE